MYYFNFNSYIKKEEKGLFNNNTFLNFLPCICYANHLVELLACNINLKIKRDFTPQLHLTQTKQHGQYVDDTNITDRPEISQFSIQIQTLVAYETIFDLLIKPSSQLDAPNLIYSISLE